MSNLYPSHSIRSLITFLCVCISSSLYAQQNKIQDSLKILRQFDSAMFYLEVNSEKSKKFFKTTEKMLDTSDFPFLRARMYIGLGTFERIHGNYVKSMEYRLQSLKLHQELEDSLGIAINYHNIAVILRDQRKFEEAEAYLKKAIAIKKHLPDVRELAQSYNILGVVYRKQKKYDLAEKNYQIAYDLAGSVGDKDRQMNIRGNMATLYSVQKRYEESIAINKAALPYYDSIQKQTSLASRHYNIGYSYYRLKRYDSALVYVNKAISIAEKEKLKLNIANYYKRKSTILRKQKKYKEALSSYVVYKRVYDSIFNIKNAEKIKALLLENKFKNQYELDSIAYSQSERELVLQANTERHRKNMYLAMLVGAIVILFIGYNAHEIKRRLLSSEIQKTNLQKVILNERLEANKREIEQIFLN